MFIFMSFHSSLESNFEQSFIPLFIFIAFDVIEDNQLLILTFDFKE